MARSKLHRLGFLLVIITTIDILFGRANAMDMDGMPIDPVSGDMVMSEAYSFNLLNGQALRFASQDTLTTFLHDPKSGLQGVSSAIARHAGIENEESVLCPVCGMASSVTHGLEVVMVHGDQAVHTCSMTHAREVFNDILSFRASPETNVNEPEHGYCTGPGTTMLNGFSLSGTSTPCILLWFPAWVLNSRMRYLLGGAFVAIVAVFNEYLLQLRRVLRKESSVKLWMSANALQSMESDRLLQSTAQSVQVSTPCGLAWFRTMSPEVQHGVHSLLHGVTLFVAYMLMLVAMTYDFTLLLWVIGGYVCGHYVFGERCEAPLSSRETEATFP